MTNSEVSELLELAERYRADVLSLYKARSGTIYGGLSPYAIFGPAHVALKNAGLMQSLIPPGCMGPITKLTPKGRKIAKRLRARSETMTIQGER